MARVVVIGSGVSGLSCALLLAESGHDVQIRAKEPAAQTTSAVAAAVWYPLRGERDARVDRWLPASLTRFTAIAADPASGVRLGGGIELFRAPADDTWWRDVLPGFRRARATELPPGYADGFVADGVPLIEMPIYLAWLEARAARAGVRIVMRTVAMIDECFEDADVVVNCSGLGARELCGDASMRAVRGQVVRVAQFGLERYVLDEANPEGIVYVYPRSRDVVVGGTREDGDEERASRPETARAIVARAAALEPRLHGAEVLSHGVGLRPARPSVRLEAEHRPLGLLVHDYGHGGSGVTLSWGCAEEVAAVVAGATHE